MQIAEESLLAIQRHFHAVIRGRAGGLIDEHGVVLPELAPRLTAAEPKSVFPHTRHVRRIQLLAGGRWPGRQADHRELVPCGRRVWSAARDHLDG